MHTSQMSLLDLKSFEKELKAADTIDSRFYRNLKQKGIIRPNRRFKKIRIRSPDAYHSRNKNNIDMMTGIRSPTVIRNKNNTIKYVYRRCIVIL